MKKLMIGLVAAAAMVGCCTQPCDGIKDSGTTYMADALAPYIEKGELPGVVSMLYSDGVTETACLGYADVAKKRKITADDVYMQCSQTKGFCGVTIAKLVEDGKISLDDPVSKYLPEFATLWVNGGETNGVRTLVKAKNVLTVRMCLNHTGGFPFETCAKRPDIKGGGWSGGAPLRQNAAVAAASPLLFEPGTKVQYSNTGIDIGVADARRLGHAVAVEHAHRAGELTFFNVWGESVRHVCGARVLDSVAGLRAATDHRHRGDESNHEFFHLYPCVLLFI